MLNNNTYTADTSDTMKKYWFMGVLFVFVIALSVSVVVIRVYAVNAIETQQKPPPLNPTEFILKLSGTPPAERPDRRFLGPPIKAPPASTSSSLDSNRELAKARLTDAKLKLCESKSKNILKRSGQMEELVARMEAKFTSIADGVKAYYLRKGFTLANYAELVTAIDAKEQTLDSALVVAKADTTSFSCTGENPAEQVKKYHTDMQSVLAALEEYRKSIKDLISAIGGISIPNVPSVSPTSSL